LHESGKLYCADLGNPIFDFSVSGPPNFLPPKLKTKQEIINMSMSTAGVDVVLGPNASESMDLLPETTKNNYRNFIYNQPTTKYIEYIQLLLNMIPKVPWGNNNELKSIPVIDLSTSRYHRGIFMCAIPPHENEEIYYGVNQKVEFVSPNLELCHINRIALYSKLKNFNSIFNGNSPTDFTYEINEDKDQYLYDKLFKTYVGSNEYYFPPRCYGYCAYSHIFFWILTNNGIFATSDVQLGGA
jgi:hypothetical protein